MNKHAGRRFMRKLLPWHAPNTSNNIQLLALPRSPDMLHDQPPIHNGTAAMKQENAAAALRYLSQACTQQTPSWH